MVARTKELFETRYGGKFLVIIWWQDAPAEPVTRALKARGVTPVRIEEVLPDFSADPARYELYDRHPTVGAHQAIARWLMQYLHRTGDSQRESQ